MIALIIIGLAILAIGKVKLTKSIVLVGRKARWYGLTLAITAIPFALIVGGLIAAIISPAVLGHPVWRRVINYGVLIAYMVLLALPFRERNNPNVHSPPTPNNLA